MRRSRRTVMARRSRRRPGLHATSEVAIDVGVEPGIPPCAVSAFDQTRVPVSGDDHLPDLATTVVAHPTVLSLDPHALGLEDRDADVGMTRRARLRSRHHHNRRLRAGVNDDHRRRRARPRGGHDNHRRRARSRMAMAMTAATNPDVDADAHLSRRRGSRKRDERDGDERGQRLERFHVAVPFRTRVPTPAEASLRNRRRISLQRYRTKTGCLQIRDKIIPPLVPRLSSRHPLAGQPPQPERQSAQVESTVTSF